MMHLVQKLLQKSIVEMAETLAEETEHLDITPYQFEPTEMSINYNSEDSKSEDQAIFMDRLGHTL